MPETTLLIIDDEYTTLDAIKREIQTEGPYRILTESNLARALACLETEAVDLVLCDLKLRQSSAMEVLDELQKQNPNLPVIMYANEENPDEVAEALSHGAANFVSDPTQPKLLAAAVESALTNLRLQGEVEKLKKRLGGDHKLGGLVGRSTDTHRLFDTIREVAEVDSTVLIRGETGTGKELVARALHYEGTRSNKPFVKVNCAALPETLLESELFGHEKGAFTDARQQRIGKFELANGGTIFLDEIGDISLSTQVKLLNVLQDREIERLGGNKRIPINIRLITATNRDLEKLIQEGRFRLDLYYRLNVVPITIKPLRERREDIPLLCAHFLDKIGGRLHKGTYTITDEAMAMILMHSWPGNVRELENAIERAILSTQGTVIVPESFTFLKQSNVQANPLPNTLSTEELGLPVQFAQPKSDSGELNTKPGPLKPAVKSFEKLFIENALEASGGHVVKAARLLKIDRTTLWKKARDLGINMHEEKM